MWYNRLKIGKDDVGSIVAEIKPTSSLVWADVIRADFQTVISHCLWNFIMYLFCAAQKTFTNYIYAKIQAEICMFT